MTKHATDMEKKKIGNTDAPGKTRSSHLSGFLFTPAKCMCLQDLQLQGTCSPAVDMRLCTVKCGNQCDPLFEHLPEAWCCKMCFQTTGRQHDDFCCASEASRRLPLPPALAPAARADHGSASGSDSISAQGPKAFSDVNAQLTAQLQKPVALHAELPPPAPAPAARPDHSSASGSASGSASVSVQGPAAASADELTGLQKSSQSSAAVNAKLAGRLRLERLRLVSKALASVLRYNAKKLGVEMLSDGFARVTQVLATSKLKTALAKAHLSACAEVAVKEIVQTSLKRDQPRFELWQNPFASNDLWIRSTKSQFWPNVAAHGKGHWIGATGTTMTMRLSAHNVEGRGQAQDRLANRQVDTADCERTVDTNCLHGMHLYDEILPRWVQTATRR
mmetsp:Transcript_89284/g.177517  ORF Transcript_89284/g.177517 Transcript_89284/m.177517 type:complete len:391 (+) Transcript_89284:311-1483(+)